MTPPDPTRILFLDIDGVLLSGNHLHDPGNRHRPPGWLPRAPVELLDNACSMLGLTVVVSSTWRMFGNCRELLELAGFNGRFHDDWCTGYMSNPDPKKLIHGGRRGLEIADWLTRHPETVAYIIIDDDSDMMPEQRPHFLQTKFQDGLQPWHISVIQKILERQGVTVS